MLNIFKGGHQRAWLGLRFFVLASDLEPFRIKLNGPLNFGREALLQVRLSHSYTI